MKCWHCKTDLTWNNDYNIEDENDDYCMETQLSCHECGAFVSVYLPKQNLED